MTRTALVHTIANLIILSVATVAEIAFGIANIDNLPLVCDSFCPSSTKMVTIMKILMLMARRRRVQKCLDTLHDLYLSETIEENVAINARISHFGRNITLCLAFLTNVTCFSYVAIPIGKYFVDTYSGTEYVRELPFKSVFPFDPYKSPVYEITYIILSYSGYITIAGIVGLDGLFVGLCLHISGQFQIIQANINTLVDREIAPLLTQSSTDDEFTKEQNEVIYRRLRSYVRRQIVTISLCEEMVEIFKPSVLMHFISAAFVICFSSVNLILSSGITVFLYANYIGAATTQLFLYSIGGTSISTSSSEICNSAYFFEWHKSNKDVRRLLLMLMMRAQKESGVFVPFFQACLPTFATILRTAGSYIALLKTFL
ncbi:odorant receptor 22c [Lutzomyia longipalpis]|uniref:odorant receptor 22c n=1 Tax=Lutzomyia longipalpis TaxID=7200 RepID=UPI00248375BC|nr:odorant receptor 22c [Lutzomyia longipalpis]